MLLGLNPFRTWLVIGMCVGPPLSLHTQIAIVAMLWASEFPKDGFDHPRLGSLAPSLVNTGLASPFSRQHVIWCPKQKDFEWDHQQEINTSIPGFQSSSTWRTGCPHCCQKPS